MIVKKLSHCVSQDGECLIIFVADTTCFVHGYRRIFLFFVLVTSLPQNSFVSDDACRYFPTGGSSPTS